METDKPQVLYRGTRDRLDKLTPQPVYEQEKSRFPEGTKAVVFATQNIHEALAYAVTQGRGLPGFDVYPYWKDEGKGIVGWKLKLMFRQSELPKDDTIFLCELNPDEFSQNTEGEWYSKNEVRPQKVNEMTIEDALKRFDEVEFDKDLEITIPDEGNGMRL
jgi:hypothetical protein